MKRNLEDPEIEPIVKKRKVELQTFQEKLVSNDYPQHEYNQETADNRKLPNDFDFDQITSEYLLKEKVFVQRSVDIASQLNPYNQEQTIQEQTIVNNYVQQPNNIYAQPQPLQYNQMLPMANNYAQSVQNTFAQSQPVQYNQVHFPVNNNVTSMPHAYVQPSQYNQALPVAGNFNRRLESFMFNTKFRYKIQEYINGVKNSKIKMFINDILSSKDVELKNHAIDTYSELIYSHSTLCSLTIAIKKKNEQFVKLILNRYELRNICEKDSYGNTVLHEAIKNEVEYSILEKIIQKSPRIAKLAQYNGDTILNQVASSYVDKNVAKNIIYNLSKNYMDTEDIAKALKIEKTNGESSLIQEQILDQLIDVIEDIVECDISELTNPKFKQKFLKHLTPSDLKYIKLSQLFEREHFKYGKWCQGYEEAFANPLLDFTDSYAKELLAKNFFKIIGVSKSLGDSQIKVIASEYDIMSVIIEYLAPYGFWPELYDTFIEDSEEEVSLAGEELILN